MPTFPIQSLLNNLGAPQIYFIDLAAGLNGAAGFHTLITPVMGSVRLGIITSLGGSVVAPAGTFLSLGASAAPSAIIPATDAALMMTGRLWLAPTLGPGFGEIITADVPLMSVATLPVGYTITGGPVTGGLIIFVIQANPIFGTIVIDPALTPF